MAKIHKHLLVFLSAGQVYPLFYRLERDELIEIIPSKNTRKKTFALTSKGVRSYREMLHEVDQVYQMLAYFALLNEDLTKEADVRARETITSALVVPHSSS